MVVVYNANTYIDSILLFTHIREYSARKVCQHLQTDVCNVAFSLSLSLFFLLFIHFESEHGFILLFLFVSFLLLLLLNPFIFLFIHSFYIVVLLLLLFLTWRAHRIQNTLACSNFGCHNVYTRFIDEFKHTHSGNGLSFPNIYS